MLKNKRILIIIIAIILVVLIIFGLQLLTGSGISGFLGLALAPFDTTPTATAFQPLAATETYFPTDYPTPTPTMTPKPVKVIPVSNTEGVDPIEQPDNQVNILILGSDQKYKGMVGRTDAIILLTINKDDDTVHVTSFPRDLYVYIPRWTNQRINTAYAHGGFQMMQDTMLHNFGFKPDYFILVNLYAFEYLVDGLGGIYLDVPQTICDNKWGEGQSHCIYPGRKLVYGKEALWYARSRETTNDFDRNYRQQLVLGAIFDRLLSLDTLGKIPELYSTYMNNVTTNLDLATIVSLAPTAAKLTDRSRISQYFISEASITHWIAPSGAMVLLPNFQTIRTTLNQALNAP